MLQLFKVFVILSLILFLILSPKEQTNLTVKLGIVTVTLILVYLLDFSLTQQTVPTLPPPSPSPVSEEIKELFHFEVSPWKLNKDCKCPKGHNGLPIQFEYSSDEDRLKCCHCPKEKPLPNWVHNPQYDCYTT